MGLHFGFVFVLGFFKLTDLHFIMNTIFKDEFAIDFYMNLFLC